MSKVKTKWEQSFDAATADHNGVFGHNIEMSKSEFRHIAKLTDIDFTDYYSATITLPDNKDDSIDVLFAALELQANEQRLNKSKTKLMLEWHY